MKKVILELFGVSENDEPKESVCIKRASAALFVEIMAADRDWSDAEQTQILNLLTDKFSIDVAEAEQIIAEVTTEHRDRHDLFQFTSTINAEYSQEEKFELVCNLWTVAYSDGHLDAHEEHIIRRIGDLIHLKHSEFIRAKIAVRDGQNPGA